MAHRNARLQNPRLLIGVLLLVIVPVDIVAFALLGMRSPTWPEAVVWALYLSQLSLTAVWLALGRTERLPRIGAAVTLVLAWFAALSLSADTRRDLDYWTLFTAMIVGAVALPLLAVRPLGLRIVSVAAGAPPGDCPTASGPFQFTIRYMLGLTTAVAAVLGTLKWMVQWGERPFGIIKDIRIVMLVGGCALVAWAGLWAVLGQRHAVLRTVALVAAVAAGVAGVGANNDPDARILLLLYAAMLFGLLCVFRLAGYRAVFRRGGAAAEPQAVADGNAEPHK